MLVSTVSRVNQLSVYMDPLFVRFFSHMAHWAIEFTVLYSRSLLVICFIYSRVDMFSSRSF